MFFRSTTTCQVRSKAPRGLPALPRPDREVVLRARRSMDLLVASRNVPREKGERELPLLSEENLKYLNSFEEKATLAKPQATVGGIPESFLAGLGVISSVLGSYSADELDQLLHECTAPEREVLLASLVLRLRASR